jgi:hypothetical protein
VNQNEVELKHRAERESDAILRVWLHDSRRLVQRVARAELRKREQ